MNRLFVCLIVGALLCLVGWTAHTELSESTSPPQLWAYEAFEAYTAQAPDKLNQRGAQGWELVATVCPRSYDSCLYYMKRPR